MAGISINEVHTKVIDANKLFFDVNYNSPINLARETLLKGKAQYSSPPCTNLFRSAPFCIENVIYILNKTRYLNEEVNCTEPSPSAFETFPVRL